MSTFVEGESPGPSGVPTAPLPADNSTVASATASASGHSDLLEVLRDIRASLKTLTAHVTTKNSVLAPTNQAPGEIHEVAFHINNDSITTSSDLVPPFLWDPRINKLSLDELVRVNARLQLPPSIPESINQLQSSLGGRTKSLLITNKQEAREHFGREDLTQSTANIEDEILQAMWNPQKRVENRRIDDVELARVQNATWSPFKSVTKASQTVNPRRTFEVVPKGVTNADWSYYRPVYQAPEKAELTWMSSPGGNGRNNFIAPWNSQNFVAEYRVPENFNPYGASIWLPVPYPATPPHDLCIPISPNQTTPEPFRGPFTDPQYAQFCELLGGLWTLPPDGRLDLEFQHHVFRKKGHNIDIAEQIKQAKIIRSTLERLIALDGSFEITEIDGALWGEYTYQPFESVTACDAEEWFLKIPPKLIRVTPQGVPIEEYSFPGYISDPRLMNLWRRIVRIRGLADVYNDDKRPWTATSLMYIYSNREPRYNMLFQLHTSCSLKANEKLKSDWQPSIFHITWMEMGPGKVGEGLHEKWKRRRLPPVPGSQDTIRTVAASIEYFTLQKQESKPSSKKYWTILALLPQSLPTHTGKEGHTFTKDPGIDSHRDDFFWKAMIHLITASMEVATLSWVAVARHMEQLLPSPDSEQIHIEDGSFSQSNKLFWIISKIDEILPMIVDTMAQWKWFSEANNLSPGDDPLTPSIKDGELPDKQFLKPIIEQIRRLNDCKTEFEALRERARSFRDGIFNLTSVKEARESRILAYNVKLLTYVTIFYLPLAFCTSLWAINNMFGQGVRGFAVITPLISCGTYAVVFGLLHRPSRQSIVAFLKDIQDPTLRSKWTRDVLDELKNIFLPSFIKNHVRRDSQVRQGTQDQV